MNVKRTWVVVGAAIAVAGFAGAGIAAASDDVELRDQQPAPVVQLTGGDSDSASGIDSADSANSPAPAPPAADSANSPAPAPPVANAGDNPAPAPPVADSADSPAPVQPRPPIHSGDSGGSGASGGSAD